MTAGDPWPHFDPDERTETILHLQARQELESMQFSHALRQSGWNREHAEGGDHAWHSRSS